MKAISVLNVIVLALLLLVSSPAIAKMGSGEVDTGSSNVNMEIFGSLKSYPHFIGNVDFNQGDTKYDYLIDENGIIDNDEVTVRNQFRLGFKGGGDNWSFSSILEADFSLSKGNIDRGSRQGEIDNLGMTGEDFGVEKLKFTYDFSSYGVPATLKTGWSTNHLDLETGGILYGDDHPFVGLCGKVNKVKWDVMTLFINDAIGDAGSRNDSFGDVTPASRGDSDQNNWTAYTAKMVIPFNNLNISPMYAYSDNRARNAEVHYMGLQAYGQMGMFAPQAEFVYAVGEKDNYNATGTQKDADISAYGGYAAVVANVSDALNPYVGGYMLSGDDDASDDEVNAYNPITNISRYSGPFGMENAMIYRGVPVLGSPLYGNAPERAGANTGYGGISNDASAENPGLQSLGIGTKGTCKNWSYKAQLQYFWFEDTGALEDVTSRTNDIDNAIGYEGDMQITYNFSDNFSLGNVISVFDPGDGVEDLRGPNYDAVAVVDTIEMKWNF